MSKELEALARQKENVKELRKTRFIEYSDDFALIEQTLKRNEPMKPLIKDMGFEHYNLYCPSCKEYVGFRNSVRESSILKYCPDCGQCIKEEE